MSLNPSQDASLLSKIDHLLDENLEDENYGVAELVASIGISRTQLHRRLKSIAGKSTSSYIREYRLIKAHEMLENDVATASEIAYRVGFASPSYFSTAFKNFYGYSPGEAKLKKHTAAPVRKKSIAPLWLVLGIIVVSLTGYWSYQNFNTIDQDNSKILGDPAIKEKAIAVLAFEDLSDDQNRKYLGMGLAVEVINILDEVDGLKVIGKTSAFSFVDKNLTIDSIATLLGVNYILEGTISESEQGLEVVSILTDGASGRTLSSESYKMPKEEVSKIKDEIAKQVAYELKIKVNEDVILASSSKEAKLLALEERAFYRRSKGATVNEIISIWDECLSIDSTYIPCLANRSRFTRSEEEHLSYVQKMEVIDPTNPYTYFVKGNYFFERELDFQNAYLNYNKMLETGISDTRVLSEAAFRLGHFNISKGMEYLKISMDKDPLFINNYNYLSNLYLLDGQYKKSIDLLLERMTITDGFYPWQIMYINVYGGYYEDAEMSISKFLANPGSTNSDYLEFMTFVAEMFLAAGRKDHKKFESYLPIAIEKRLEPFPLACALSLIGDYDRSFEWLEKGYETKNMGYFEELKYAPWFKEMRLDPRWSVLMKKFKMPGYEDDKVKI